MLAIARVARAARAARVASRRLPTTTPAVVAGPALRQLSSSRRHLNATPAEETPSTSKFFEYTWGTWLHNDKLEKARRQTKFDVDSLTHQLHTYKPQAGLLPPTKQSGISWLDHNVAALLGEHGRQAKQISSIHEGKHHHVYKIDFDGTDTSLVLRVPYKLESDAAIARKIKSEAAVLDFLHTKAQLNVPRLVAYAPDAQNPVGSPFTLMEYVSGDLLMKQWNPLAEASDNVNDDLKRVIDPISDFQAQVNKYTFTKYGSLYFADDVDPEHATDEPAYTGETDDNLVNRWKIGPSIEQSYAKNKRLLPAETIKQFAGPWPRDSPDAIISDLAQLELENARQRLARVAANAGGDANKDLLREQIKTFENFAKVAPKLINPHSPSIMHVDEQFQPRLYLPDLDPLNVIDGPNGLVFIDFEYAVIKPFLYQQYPQFITYDGDKIYDLENEIPEWDQLDELDQGHFKFMHYKTRNQHLWEHALNDRSHDLIAIASPHIKNLKAPYVHTLNISNDEDHLYVEDSMIALAPSWQAYTDAQLTNTEDPDYPIKYDEKYVEEMQSKLRDYQTILSSEPFAAIGGWVPQDMFDNLKAQGFIEQDHNGNYSIAKNKVLQEDDADTE
ncbi:hypothetical protein DIURU_003131 [Diutina rugosa]|uniref:Altered inheritance of mitochondria protein 9, mitochondrial n=1 Tax=Diutina rugosa TaxID=5481 RepID=A0A642UTP9_DIURU|nr:uncharacterized protein DIURU_003131 [Diutina rugosa]KAA8901603.1 hypothetical protein DIURU_003131 [Diutina rugosa]